MISPIERVRITVCGAVQGVGFRPFVYRVALELGLKGWVQNSSRGVFIEIEGDGVALRRFLIRIEKEKPPQAIIQSLEFFFLDAAGFKNFEIRPSDESGVKTAFILPDIAPCADCLREIFDPDNRRYRYPFTNCTHCGPRFTIIEEVPYDRSNTSMKKFAMCPQCNYEYQDPADRRFHAQPNACPACGPHLEWWDARGKVLAWRDDALRQAVEKILGGGIVALKGVGGFQLITDARNETAVNSLRERKRREEKPLAVMYPSLESVRQDCLISDLEERLLSSPEAPIVLLQRRTSRLAASLTPGNPNLGVMLPYSPLHHLLLRDLGFPVVATSGNLSDEPICIEEGEALRRLAGIADFFLTHNRPIVRHADDSVVRVVCDREMMLRRARGYAPLPIHRKASLPCILAVGAHLKNTVALNIGTEIFISQHIGDLETSEAHAAFRAVAADLPRLYATTPGLVACDLHPDYLSTKHASQWGVPICLIQHHWAHVVSCMAENEIEGPALGVAWDGAGYGPDGTIWGGEFLLAERESFRRIAHLRPFRLPGGEAAIREPRRAALGLLFVMGGNGMLEQRDLAPFRDFSPIDLALVRRMLEKGFQSPVTSSAGRLFDAVAALTGLRQIAHFEGQAAMALEFAVTPGIEASYGFHLKKDELAVIDWEPMVEEIVADVRRQESMGMIAAKFHNALAEMIVAVARRAGEEKVVLTGGCFQNRYLIERSVRCLIESGFKPYWHQRVPANDGGLSLGQAVAAGWSLTQRSGSEKVAVA
ncbi:MAG TPA: carbamoyltransferase HypF [Candidatus Methylacidiphilales bacterium]|nr:carbamoyltransferase HypF [Candidatus Methylacidiphilales bacterium]